MLKFVVLPAALAASVCMAPPAFASTPDGVRTVSYIDLDLTRQSGRQVLQARVARAVRQVCGSPVAAPLAERAAQRACARTASEGAGAQVARAVELAHGRQIQLAATW